MPDKTRCEKHGQPHASNIIPVQMINAALHGLFELKPVAANRRCEALYRSICAWNAVDCVHFSKHSRCIVDSMEDAAAPLNDYANRSKRIHRHSWRSCSPIRAMNTGPNEIRQPVQFPIRHSGCCKCLCWCAIAFSIVVSPIWYPRVHHFYSTYVSILIAIITVGRVWVYVCLCLFSGHNTRGPNWKHKRMSDVHRRWDV